ncbi:hypothetical protein Tco_0455220 [Tanacetum coccineum]
MVLSNSTYEVGGPSTATPELPFPVGRPFSVIVDSVVVHHEEIGGLSVRTENLEHALGKLTMKTGKVEVLTNQHDLMINKVVEVESHVLKMKDRVNTHPCDQGTMSEDQQLWTRLAESESHESIMISYILWMEKCLTTLEERLQGPSRGCQ